MFHYYKAIAARISVAPLLAALVFASIQSHIRAEDIEPGLYLRTTYFAGNLDISTVYFGAGNKIAFNPKHGTDPFDYDAAAKESPATVGTYTLAKDKLAIKWSNGKTTSLSVEFEKGKISAYDGGLVSKADVFKPNTMLNATYSWAASTANVSAAHTLNLTSDGKYTADHFGGIHHIPGNSGKAESKESGTYTLTGNTLALKSAAGTVFKHTVIPMNTALDPAKATLADDHIIFDSLNMKREK